MRTSIFNLLLVAPLLASLPEQVSAQYSGGPGRGDVQASFVPVVSGITPVSPATHTPLHGWPVPTNNILQLDRVVTAAVYDMGGQLLRNVARSNVVDMNGLAPGAYLLRTERGEVLRFVRE